MSDERPGGDPPDGGGDPVALLQEAVLALVAAARAALDLVERAAREPGPVLEALADVGRAAVLAGDPAGRAGGDPPAGGPSRVQRIRVVQDEGGGGEGEPTG